VRPRTWIAVLLVSASMGCRAPHGSSCPDRERALAVAMGALARSRDAESPRAILSAFEEEGVCASDRLDRRVRCHLIRPTVEVDSSCARGQWTFVLHLPELSDHVHRVRVWRRGGALAVGLESEN
jgi:hypothetical protein